MGTPRETLRLVREDGGVRMVTTRSAKDYTDAMNAWSRKRVEALATEDLDGYVLKKDSPSCGMERVKVYGSDGPGVRDGRGLFAAALIASGAIAAGRGRGTPLRSATSRELHRTSLCVSSSQSLFASRWSHGALVRFHTAHKMSLLAHSTTAYRSSGGWWQQESSSRALSCEAATKTCSWLRSHCRPRPVVTPMSSATWPVT